MGLFDFNNDQDMMKYGLLSAAFQNMANPNSPINPMSMVMNMRQMQGQKKLHDLQLAEYERKAAEQQRAAAEENSIRTLARNSLLSPQQQAIGAMGPTQQAADMIPNLKPKFDQAGFMQGLYGIDPLKAMALEQSMRKEQPKPELVTVQTPQGPVQRWVRPGEATGIDVGAPAPKETAAPWYVQKDATGNVTGINPFEIELRKASRPLTNNNVFNNTKDDFKNERDLRNDFSGLPTTKAFREVETAYDQIKTAIKQASPAGDLAAATKIMKLLDPGSVVRESELGMAMAATGMLDRIQNYAQMTLAGTKLTPTQREDFSTLANKLYEAAAGRYNQSAHEYRGVAKDYNLNADRIAKPVTVGGGWSATVIR